MTLWFWIEPMDPEARRRAVEIAARTDEEWDEIKAAKAAEEAEEASAAAEAERRMKQQYVMR